MSMVPVPKSVAGVDLVQRLAAANGLSLSPERAAALVPALEAILDADAAISALRINILPAAGLPWEGMLLAPMVAPESDSRG